MPVYSGIVVVYRGGFFFSARMMMPESPYYEIRNWKQFQHYKDRCPPWIKLHYEMLSSEDWVMLDDASRVLAIACMLIASRHDGRVPANPLYIQRVAYLNQAPNFQPLVSLGFLLPQAGASTLQAGASGCPQMLNQSAQAKETEAETEAEKETDPPTPPQGGPVGEPSSKRKKPRTVAEKKRTKVDANTPLMVRIGKWYDRKPETCWSVYEHEALQQLLPIEDDELDLLEWFCTSDLPEGHHRRNSIETLLNNWSGEVDRARGARREHERWYGPPMVGH